MNTKFSQSKLVIKNLDYMEELFKDISSLSGGSHSLPMRRSIFPIPSDIVVSRCPKGSIPGRVTISLDRDEPPFDEEIISCIPLIPPL